LIPPISAFPPPLRSPLAPMAVAVAAPPAFAQMPLAAAAPPPPLSGALGARSALQDPQIAGRSGVGAGLSSGASGIGGIVVAGAATSVCRRGRGARRAPNRRQQQRGATTVRHARKVVTDIENEVSLTLPRGSAASMDKFMAENAVSVSLQNLEKMEDKPGEADVKYCYLEPTDIGPFRTQMRMTVRVDLPGPGRCDVKILNMENGTVDKATGEVTFPEPKDAPPFSFDTSNSITWEDSGSADGLKVRNACKARSEMTLPFWFPLPEKIVQGLTTTFVKRVITSGQEKVMEQMEERYTTWATQGQSA